MSVESVQVEAEAALAELEEIVLAVMSPEALIPFKTIREAVWYFIRQAHYAVAEREALKKRWADSDRRYLKRNLRINEVAGRCTCGALDELIIVPEGTTGDNE